MLCQFFFRRESLPRKRFLIDKKETERTLKIENVERTKFFLNFYVPTT